MENTTFIFGTQLTVDEYKEAGMTCKDCAYWEVYDCGHINPESEICGDFYVDWGN